MQQVTVNHNWLGAGTRVVSSVVAAAAAFVAGYLLAFVISWTFVAALGLADSVLPPLVLSIPWVLWLFVGSAAAEDSWRGAAKRIGFLVTATAAAFVAGFLPLILLLLADEGSLFVIPLLPLLLAGAVAPCVRLARRSRIFKPWLAWFLIGVMSFVPAFVALFALSGGTGN